MGPFDRVLGRRALHPDQMPQVDGALALDVRLERVRPFCRQGDQTQPREDFCSVGSGLAMAEARWPNDAKAQRTTKFKLRHYPRVPYMQRWSCRTAPAGSG